MEFLDKAIVARALEGPRREPNGAGYHVSEDRDAWAARVVDDAIALAAVRERKLLECEAVPASPAPAPVERACEHRRGSGSIDGNGGSSFKCHDCGYRYDVMPTVPAPAHFMTNAPVLVKPEMGIPTTERPAPSSPAAERVPVADLIEANRRDMAHQAWRDRNEPPAAERADEGRARTITNPREPWTDQDRKYGRHIDTPDVSCFQGPEYATHWLGDTDEGLEKVTAAVQDAILRHKGDEHWVAQQVARAAMRAARALRRGGVSEAMRNVHEALGKFSTGEFRSKGLPGDSTYEAWETAKKELAALSSGASVVVDREEWNAHRMARLAAENENGNLEHERDSLAAKLAEAERNERATRAALKGHTDPKDCDGCGCMMSTTAEMAEIIQREAEREEAARIEAVKALAEAQRAVGTAKIAESRASESLVDEIGKREQAQRDLATARAEAERLRGERNEALNALDRQVGVSESLRTAPPAVAVTDCEKAAAWIHDRAWEDADNDDGLGLDEIRNILRDCTRAASVEEVARAIHESNGSPIAWADVREDARAMYRNEVRAALRALGMHEAAQKVQVEAPKVQVAPCRHERGSASVGPGGASSFKCHDCDYGYDLPAIREEPTPTNAPPPAPAQAGWTQAERDVLAERVKQRAKWGDAHDDEHDAGEIGMVAADLVSLGEQSDGWGLARKHPQRRDRLVIASALLIAEVERIDRSTKRKAGRA